MFFEHLNAKFTTEQVNISTAVLVCDFPNAIIKERFETIKAMSKDEGERVDKVIIKKVETTESKEEYFVEIGKDIIIKTPTFQGANYALSDLKDMLYSEGIFKGAYSEKPVIPLRGYRVYMPSRENLEDFYKAIDLILDLKYNAVDIEVGGAMEYKRHPKINEKWLEYAEDMHEYSGKAFYIQEKFAWEKNSIHVDNAEGEVLTQDEVRDIVQKLKAKGLEVVPEVPTLSHSDYICLAYPELAERKEDPYPDTYCPSNPKSYEVVFDILDEVIDVFQPTWINIGHDELYTACICDKCKDKVAHELFTEDITKIRNYLAEKNIKTMMWGEKLLNAQLTNTGNSPGGGAGFDYQHKNGSHRFMHPLFECKKYIPKDVFCLNWYYCIDWKNDYDLAYVENGISFGYGNFRGTIEFDWQLSLQRGVSAVFVSNWGNFIDKYMQRNHQYFYLFTAAYITWNKTYDTKKDVDDLKQRTAAYLYNKFTKDNGWDLEILHTTNKDYTYRVFYDGEFIDEKYDYGEYQIQFDDGKTYSYSVVMGGNITFEDAAWLGKEHHEITCSTLPVFIDGKMWCKAGFKKPYEGAIVKSISFVANEKNKEFSTKFKLLDSEL